MPGLLPVSESLQILRFALLGTAGPELDKRERIEDRACKDAATASSANIPCACSGTITLRVPYGTDYLSFLLAPPSIARI
jgi:hypothetical protein